MKPRSMMLIGGPDSGKTNYVARLWEALRSGAGRLKVIRAENIKDVEEALAHLLQGRFAPRSEKNIEESRRDFKITLGGDPPLESVDLVVPDVTGELWKTAVETSELPADWMGQLAESSAALLFLRVLSDQNVSPLDWVTTQRLLRMAPGGQNKESAIPTQVLLSELLRFLELKLHPSKNGDRPRVAVLVTAWDLLDRERKAAGPFSYIESEYPLFAGRIMNNEALDIKVFGTSVVGGDLERDDAFRAHFVQGDLRSSGFVVTTNNGRSEESLDLTLPITWLIEV